MRLYLSILFCSVVYLNSFSQQGCSIDRGRAKTLTEFLYQNNKSLLVFRGKVKSSDVVLSSGEASSIINIEEIYFGKTYFKEVKIITGSFPPSGLPALIAKPVVKKEDLNTQFTPGAPIIDKELFTTSDWRNTGKTGFKMLVGDTYLIFGNDTSDTQNYEGTYSKVLKETSLIKNEIETLKGFEKIFIQKKTGYFKFKNHKGYIVAEGSYTKGIQSGIWKHYDVNGRILCEVDIKKNSIKEFLDNGCIGSIITKYKDSTAYETFKNDEKNRIQYKNLEIKKDSVIIRIHTNYDNNGNIIDKKTELDIYHKSSNSYSGLGYHGSYQEFYPNGKVKLNAQYLLQRRVGCWTWYNEDGTFWAEWDYKDGKAPQ